VAQGIQGDGQRESLRGDLEPAHLHVVGCQRRIGKLRANIHSPDETKITTDPAQGGFRHAQVDRQLTVGHRMCGPGVAPDSLDGLPQGQTRDRPTPSTPRSDMSDSRQTMGLEGTPPRKHRCGGRPVASSNMRIRESLSSIDEHPGMHPVTLRHIRVLSDPPEHVTSAGGHLQRRCTATHGPTPRSAVGSPEPPVI
jgi:hypothetical protein